MILKGKAIYKIKVTSRHLPTFGREFGDVELTVLFKDGHVEVIELTEYGQLTSEYESMDAFCDKMFSGDKYLLNQSMKVDFNKLYNEVLVGLVGKGIDVDQIVDIYYMDF